MISDVEKKVAEFWPYYVTQHRNPLNRQFHFIGNSNLLFWLLLAIIKRNPFLLVFAVISSYAIAWIGHFFFERNIPATFRYPILAGLCDMIMYLKMWRGEMDAEVQKYAQREAAL